MASAFWYFHLYPLFSTIALDLCINSVVPLFKTIPVGSKTSLIRFSRFNCPSILLVRAGKVIDCKAFVCTHYPLKASRLSVQQSQTALREVVVLQACRSLWKPFWHRIPFSVGVRVVSCAGSCPSCPLVSVQWDRSLSCLLVWQVWFIGTGETWTCFYVSASCSGF